MTRLVRRPPDRRQWDAVSCLEYRTCKTRRIAGVTQRARRTAASRSRATCSLQSVEASLPTLACMTDLGVFDRDAVMGRLSHAGSERSLSPSVPQLRPDPCRMRTCGSGSMVLDTARNCHPVRMAGPCLVLRYIISTWYAFESSTGGRSRGCNRSLSLRNQHSWRSPARRSDSRPDGP